MANPKHLEILKQGVGVWNEWRNDNSNIEPDLSGVNLAGRVFDGANFMEVNLNKSNFNRASLVEANFALANLTQANLNSANLNYADFYDVDLSDVDLDNANLSGASFIWANLSRALLTRAELVEANFARANLHQADFTNSEMGWTAFANNNLSLTKGLDTVRHRWPSFISIDTIYISKGNIPEIFLRGSGVPEDFITYMYSLTVQPIQFYASFISYSSKDQKFADRLYADLQNKGVRCWLATEDLKIGAKIRSGIDEAIRLHDKLLLVLSKHSVASDWVEQEVETALEHERKEKRLILFPIRLDDAVMKIQGGWPALIRNTRNIGDFRKWKDHDSYQKAFDRLLRDLKAEDEEPTRG